MKGDHLKYSFIPLDFNRVKINLPESYSYQFFRYIDNTNIHNMNMYVPSQNRLIHSVIDEQPNVSMGISCNIKNKIVDD